MSRDIEEAKPRLVHLKLLKRLVEENLGYTLSSGITHGVGRLFSQEPLKGIPESYDWFRMEIPRAMDACHKLYRWGWVKQMKKPEWDSETKSAGGFAWYETPFIPTKRAVKYWSTEGKELYEKLMAKEQAKLEAVNRLVIIRPKGKKKTDRNAGMLVEVTKETDKRLYVKKIHHADTDVWYFDFLDGGIGGKPYYIDKGQVWMDGVTRAQYDKIVEVENHIVSQKKALRSERDQAIEELRERYREREDQMAAEFAELLQEVT